MKTIDDFNFSGRKALVRVDFNVPLDENFQITDFTRINAALPTIKKLMEDGAATILMSHLGRPKGKPADKFSLKHIVAALSEKLGVTVKFATDCVGEEAEKMAAELQAGDVLLLENLRFHKGETDGDRTFAESLSKLGDIYVNDAFGTAHRAHASTAIVAEFFSEKAAGYVMGAELDNAEKVLGAPERPFTAIMGGAKISDKIQVIEQLLDKVDNLLIGGGMAYTFFKAQGGNIGTSLLEEDKQALALELIAKAKDKGVTLLLPVDNIAADAFDNNANTQEVNSMNIPDDYMGLDIGQKSRESFAKVIHESKTIMWNGPMGVFEMPNFEHGTVAIAQAVVAATEKGAFSLIGGGDSASAINNLGFGDKVSYVSTGGGALLEYIEGKELPGVKALQ